MWTGQVGNYPYPCVGESREAKRRVQEEASPLGGGKAQNPAGMELRPVISGVFNLQW
jgi:hypothetical protein